MKRIGVILGIILVIVSIAIPVLASSWTGTILVSNNTSTSYSMLGVLTTANITYMVSQNFIQSTGNDTTVQSAGTDLPFMLSTDKITFAVPIGANTNNSFQFLTGQTQVANRFSIVTGYGGYITTNDTAALELGNIWSMPISAYIDTSVNGTVASKAGAWSILKGSGNVTTVINTTSSNVSPTSGVGGAGWLNVNNSFDGNTVTFASVTVPKLTTSSDITLDMPSNYVSSINVWPDRVGANPEITTMTVDLFYNGAWNNIYSATPTFGAWNTISLPDIVYANSVRFNFFCDNGVGVSADAHLNEVTFGISELSTVAHAIGDFLITPQSDGANFWMTAGSSSSVNMTTVAVPDTANPIIWSSNVTYFNYIDMYVNGIIKLAYLPEVIITGNTMIDRAGTKDGDITWGINPSGVTSSLTSFEPTNQTSTVSNIPDGVQDVAPLRTDNSTNVNPQTAIPPVTPITPLMQFLAGQYAYNIPEFILWMMGFWVASVIIFAITLSLFNHIGAAGILASCIFGLGIVMLHFPQWYLSLSVLGIAVSLVQENRG